MKKALLCALGVFCLTVCHAYAQIKWDTEKFMPLSEVKQGMTGKGYTVFFGTDVEAFDFEVISIEYNYFPEWHVIWCKGLSENFKRTGVAGGMSGSPIYIDGRLIGALSLGFFNQREHANLFGVTPIESMVKVTEWGMEPNANYAGAPLFNLGATATQPHALDMQDPLFGTFGGTFGTHGTPAGTARDFEERWFRSVDATPTPSTAARLSMPITVPALDSAAMRFVKPIFDKFNFTPVQAAGGGGDRIQESPVEEGQIIGTEVARGDVSFFGYGTITHVDGDQLLAYGHAMAAEGNVNIPLSGGYVHFILPSTSRSSKIAAPTQPIGTLVQDRETAIAGIIGKHPSYIPVNVNLQTSDGKQHAKAFEVIRHRSMSAIYAGFGTGFLLDSLDFFFSDHTMNAAAKITLKEHPDLQTQALTYENVYSSSGSPGSSVAQLLMLPLLQLGMNSYTKVDVESVSLDVKIEDKRQTARILSLQMDKLRYRPGDTVAVEITLQPYLEKPIVQTAEITIPTDTPDGLISLMAMNASTHQMWQQNRAPLAFRHRNINQLVELLQRDENNAAIILELFVPESGLTVQGEEFAHLPPSVMSVMHTANRVGNTGYTMGTTLHVDKNHVTDYVILGSGRLQFVVDRNAD